MKRAFRTMKTHYANQGSISILFALGFGLLCILASIAVQFRSEVHVRLLIKNINQLEGFSNGEIAAWQGYYLSLTAPTITGIYDSNIFNQMQVARTTRSKTEEGERIGRLPGSLDQNNLSSNSEDSLLRRYAKDDLRVRIRAGLLTQYCGSQSFSTKRYYGVCLIRSPAGPSECTVEGLDPSFGNGGKVITDLGSTGQRILGLTLQTDGRLVAAGDHGPSDCNSQMGCRAVAIRYNSDGTLDPGFNKAGTVISSIGPGYDRALDVLVQRDQKIVFVGKNRNNGKNNSYVARLNGDGTFDSNFGTGGIVIISLSNEDDVFFSVTEQSDGKLVAVGYSGNDGANRTAFSVARFNPNGELDKTFGKGIGFVKTDFGTSRDVAQAVFIQPDGKIVVVGQAWLIDAYQFAVSRYLPDGTLDSSFDLDGKVTIDIGNLDDDAFGVLMQPDGKLVVAGDSCKTREQALEPGKDCDFAVVRYNADGSRDKSFGRNKSGIVVVPAGSSARHGNNGMGYGVTQDSMGRILLSGAIQSKKSKRDIMAAVRITPDGVLDSTFGDKGIWEVPIGITRDFAHALVISRQGEIFLGGFSDSKLGSDKDKGDFAVVKLCVRD